MRKLYYIFGVTLIISGVFCGMLRADEDTASIAVMIGTVEYCPRYTAKWQAAEEGMALYSGDKIRTGINGMLSITFRNGSQITLKQNTEFAIGSLQMSKDTNDVNYQLELTIGRLRAAVEKLGDNSSFEIKTPTAVAAVRGTVYYLNVREAAEDEIPPDVKERLMTEIFVEKDGVIYTNTLSGRHYIVDANRASNSYGDGGITIPIEVPLDKQREWTDGWEDILAAEPYQAPGGTEGEGAGGGEEGSGEEEGNTRQSDQKNSSLNLDLINNALEAAEDALDAATNADTAANNALDALTDLTGKEAELAGAEDVMNSAYSEANNALGDAQDLYDTASAKAQETEDAITGVIYDEANKISGYVIVDIDALWERLGGLEEDWQEIEDGLKELEDAFSGLSRDGEDLANAALQASNEAFLMAGEARDLAQRLEEAINDAKEKGGDAALAALQLETLQLLIELTQDAIDKANEAARLANESASNAEGVTAEVPGMITAINGTVQALNGVSQSANTLKADLEEMVGFAESLIENVENFVDAEILERALREQEQHEKDVVTQEIHNMLLDRTYLRQQVRQILLENDLRRLDGYVEKISDAQMGKVLKDIHGNRVRVEQYVLRPSKRVVEVINVNLRAGDDLTTMQWMTSFNKSLDKLPTGQLRDLPWNDYLNTQYVEGMPSYINSPPNTNSIYPSATSVTLAHSGDSFTETREFAVPMPEINIQSISSQTLAVGGFNNGGPMNYALPQPEAGQAAGTYSIQSSLMNADIGGSESNPQGFRYDFKSAAGQADSIDAAFYVISDNGERQDGYSDLEIDDLGDALRMNMTGGNNQIGDNNLEMVFNSTIFQYGPIDLIYVPTGRMEWKSDEHIPDFSLPEAEAPEEPSF